MVGMTGLELLLLRKFRALHALNNSASVTRFLNSPRALSLSLLVNETSPLAVKTTATPVVFILAPLPRSLALTFITIHNKKTTRKGRLFYYGRNDWTRTSDLFVPNEAFYQAELHSGISKA